MFLVLTLISCVALIYYWEEIKYLRNYGYPFVFLIGFISTFSFPNPFPYVIVVFTMGSVLNPALVGTAAGLGAGIGGTLFYILGRGGFRFLPKISLLSPAANDAPHSRLPRWVSRILGWVQRRGLIAVFIASTVLVPGLFTPIAIAMGTLRFRRRWFFLMCWAGNTVKSLAIAYCGYFGLGVLLHWLGISL